MVGATPDSWPDERFEPLELLGKEGAIHTYRVRDQRDRRPAVLQRVADHRTASPEDLAPARALVGQSHPHVASILEVGTDPEGLPFVVREEISGISLKDALEQEAMTLPLGLEAMRQCLDGLEYLHARGIWAHNLAPGDVLLVASDSKLRTVIADPGLLGKWREAPAATASAGVLVGRLKHAAPEQFEGASAVGPAAGLYAYGLVLYETLTGRFPIRGDSASSLIAGHLFRPPLSFEQSDPHGRLSPELRRLAMSLLAKDPADRPPSAAAVALHLNPAIRVEVGSESPPLGPLEPLFRRAEAASSRPERESSGTETMGFSSEDLRRPAKLGAPAPIPMSPAGGGGAGTDEEGSAGPTALIRQVREEVVDEEIRRRREEERRREEIEGKVQVLLREATGRAETEHFDEALARVDEALGFLPDHAEALALRASLDACLRIQKEEREREAAIPDLPPIPVPPPEPPSPRIDPAGSVTIPMATVREAQRRHRAEIPDPPRIPDPDPPRIPDPDPTPSRRPVAEEKTEPPFPPSPAPLSERSLSDLGFGDADEEKQVDEPRKTTSYSAQRSVNPGGGPSRALMLTGLVVALGLVFALSFLISGRWANSASPPPRGLPVAPAEDVSGTDVPPGVLALDASPWAEISRLVPLGGEPVPVVGAPFTPKRLELAPGSWTLTLTHPAVAEPLEVTVRVETGKITEKHVDMGLSIDELLTANGW